MTFNCRTTLLFLPSVSYLAMGNPSDWEPSELTCAQQENAAYAFRGARLLLPQGLTALRCSFLYRFDCRCAACIPLAERMPNTRIASNSRITDHSRRQVGITKCKTANANARSQHPICNLKSRLANVASENLPCHIDHKRDKLKMKSAYFCPTNAICSQ